jgi:glycosyltransferase involved in cell wall biosynthesis
MMVLTEKNVLLSKVSKSLKEVGTWKKPHLAPFMSSLAIINGKFNKQRTTGVQRYAVGISELLSQTAYQIPASKSALKHLFWEQITLPLKANKQKKLLINFCNTAPFWYKNQIVTIHDMAVFENVKWFNPWFAFYYRWLFKQLAKNASHFVTVSEFSKREMHRHLKIDLDSISVIHSAVHDAILDVISTKPTEVPQGKFLLMVGSHDPRKNADFVIDATQEWRAQHDYKLVVAGNPGRAFAKKEKQYSKDVIWLQNLNDGGIKWLYQNAALVIHPSLYEGFSLVPIEAHLLETRCLISDIPVHKEIVGEAAHYFELDNRKDLILKIENALNAPFEKRPLPYSFEKSAKQWADLITRFDA